MSKVLVDMSMSLDGFITGPNDTVEQGLGEGGERLHEWIFRDAATHPDIRGGTTFGRNEVLAEAFERTGAIVMGRRMFDIAETAWGDNPPFQAPVFVVTHRAQPKQVRHGGTSFTFVTDGVESAFQQAEAVAGGKAISVAGGADIIQQALNDGRVDEVQIHLIPILLGSGRRLFDHLGTRQFQLEQTRVIEAPGVTHLRYRVVR
jgi:dihydrofolate reductase